MCPPSLVLIGFFPVSFQHWLKGTLSCTARRAPTTLLWHRPSTFPLGSNSAPCRTCPPSLLRLCLFSIWRGQVEGPDLSSSCCVHRGGCVACVADLLPKTLADLRGQILTTIGAFHLSGNMWAVREEAHSCSVTPVSCVTKRVEDIMPALQAYHARERELQCIATEVMQEPGSSSDLLMVQNSTHLPYPMTNFRRFLRISHNISR